MNTTSKTPIDRNQILKRHSFLPMVLAALDLEEFQFARQACLGWLANFPGDLQISYLYAGALAALGEADLAITHLEKVCRLDPEYVEPLLLLRELTNGETETENEYQSVLIYLQNLSVPAKPLSPWLRDLVKARQALKQGNLNSAEGLVLKALAKNPITPLPAILHLQIVWRMDIPTLFSTISSIYLKKWPECNQIRILSAQAMLQNGDDTTAIENLHWSAAHDTTGKVVSQLLGADHRFKPLWPESLQIFMELPVPASVASKLGWNRLSNGHIPANNKGKGDHSQAAPPQTSSVHPSTLHNGSSVEINQQDQPTSQPVEPSRFQPKKRSPDSDETVKALDEIQAAFDRIAKRIKQPNLGTVDARYPVYVILASKVALTKKYGKNTAQVIDQILQELATNIGNLPNWNSMVFYPDDPVCMAALDLSPNYANDAWKNKLSLTDLDKALAARGEMISALLIIGGNDIIPFHQLPNPTDDTDPYILSDNPYATTDENYFVPQWPVGRIPDEDGNDAGFLLEQIRFLSNEYAYKLKSKAILSGSLVAAILSSIASFFRQIITRRNTDDNIGYVAEVWQMPSSEVFEVIGNSRRLILSPPNDFSTLIFKKHVNNKCAYFNLHGLQESPEWFGQRDLTQQSNDLEYPIALVPSQFSPETPAPEIVFSEACFGAWIQEKQADQSLALKFLATGTRCMVGSTGIAYGSVKKPLIAADLLAQEFWKQLLAGQAAGYALMRAKLNLAREMTSRQGYLDGEDQKTILSFVLFGDPLAIKDNLKQMAKPLMRPKLQPNLKTVSDSHEELVVDQDAIPPDIMLQVKKTVSMYLPGLESAKLIMNPQLANYSLPYPSGKGHKSRKYKVSDSQRYVIMLNNSIEQKAVHHPHFARMTFDYKGHMIKLSTSR